MPRKPDPDSLDRFIEAGLPSLREVPPMQMSPERLRDAVLAGGLSPAPRPSALAWVPWLVAPLAAATVALAVVPRLPRAEAPTLVSPTIVRPGAVAFDRTAPPTVVPSVVPSVVETEPVETPVPSALRSAAPAATSPAATSPVATSPVAVAPARRTRTTSASVRSSRVAPAPKRGSADRAGAGRAAPTPGSAPAIVSDAAPVSSPDLAPFVRAVRKEFASVVAPVEGAQPLASADVEARASAVVPSALAPAPSRGVVILLAGDVDRSTGARAATEVDSHANISVGG